MAYSCYDNIWRIEFHNNVCAKDEVQDINPNQMNVKVNDTYKNYEKTTRIFEPSSDEDVIH